MDNPQEQQQQLQKQAAPANEINENADFDIISLPAIADDIPEREVKSMRSTKKKQTVSEQFKIKKQQDVQQSQTFNQLPSVGQEGIKDRIRFVVEHNYFSIIMSIITLYALFADDIRVIATDKDTDSIFWGFSCFCFASFSIEIILSSIANPGYFLGFFFWLDVLSTVSLILDIGWISNEIFSQNQGGKGSSSVASLAKASRASRVGTRAGRIVRVVRLVRLVRLYKHAQQVFAKQAKKFQEEQKRLREEQEQQAEQNSDSQSSINLQNATPLPPQNLTPIQPSDDPNIIPNADQQQPKISSPEMKEISLGRGSSKKKNKSLSQISPSGNNSNAAKLRRQASKVGISPAPDGLIEEDQKASQKDGSRSGPGSTIRGSRSFNSNYHKQGSLRKSSNSSFTAAENESQNTETRVGKTLSELTTKRVILIVLCIMFSLPIFDTSTYSDPDTAFNSSLELIYRWKGNSARFAESVQQYISFNKDQRTPLIYLQVDNTEYYPLNASGVDDYTQQRSDDITYYSYSDSTGNIVVTAVSSQKSDNKLDSILSIIRTIFVSVVLTMASMKFASDVEVFILEPIEKMLEKVKRISKNPLEAAQMEEQEEFMIEQLKEEGNEAELERIKSTSQYETVVLEKLIIRVGALLALGFGEAGSEIIAQNMKKSGVVDPMLPGNKIMAIFGFCDIRNFTDATEVLQTGVMVFVNEIAQIAHGIVDQYLGQANKNIGDAFLLVWKFKEKDYLRNQDGTLEFLKNDLTSNYADLSVIAFLKIQAGLTLSKKLQKYKKNPGLQARMKGYRVKMGFGLHFGWSIEGAIGSNYKIDASYLSPNVNMASRLEAATKQFGTGLLISGKLREILSDKCQSQLRKIDCVTVKGSIEPMDLYTVDTNLERLYNKRKGKDVFDFSNFTEIEKKKKKIVDKLIRNQLKIDIGKGTKRIATQFDTDPDLKEMRKEYTHGFYETWEKALELYFAGKWYEATSFIKQTLQWFENRQDGPSQTLFEFMKENGFVAPKDWKGYRMLTEK